MDPSSDQQPSQVTEAVPINIAPSTEDAPPTLAEPASGLVATMSGALQGADAAEIPKTTTVESTDGDVNGAIEDATKPDTDSMPTYPSSAAHTSLVTEPPTQDTEMKDETAPAAGSDEPMAETNDIHSASASKKQPNGKRKSTSGIPEHKNKKLNKRKSQAKMTNLDAHPGDYFFARLKSYPPWPSIVCDEEMLPQTLLSTRPVTTKQADGTYKEPYAEGGKKVADRTYAVMFLQTNEFAWIHNTDLTPLTADQVKDVAEKGKSKSLIGAYNVAAEEHPLSYFKEMLLDHQKAIQEDQEIREARDAAKAAKAEKKKRKSEIAEEDVEMEDVDDEDGETKKSTKKRKKDLESEGDEEKPTKTPKTTQKLKLTTPKAPGTTEKKAKDSAKASKSKSDKKKSKAAVDDEDIEEETKEPPQPVDPVEERKAREKEVLFLRHKLQKGFLSRDQAPQESEMIAMSSYIKKLEEYGDLEAGIIRTTKINKVLKALIKLNTIPKDEVHNFRGRSVELLGKWNKILGTESKDDGDTNGAGPSSAVEKEDDKSEPATNGHKEDDQQLEAADKPAEDATGLADSTKAVETAPEASAESKELVVDSLNKEAATEGGVEDAQKVEADDDGKMTDTAKKDVAPESASVAAEAIEATKASG